MSQKLHLPKTFFCKSMYKIQQLGMSCWMRFAKREIETTLPIWPFASRVMWLSYMIFIIKAMWLSYMIFIIKASEISCDTCVPLTLAKSNRHGHWNRSPGIVSKLDSSDTRSKLAYLKKCHCTTVHGIYISSHIPLLHCSITFCIGIIDTSFFIFSFRATFEIPHVDSITSAKTEVVCWSSSKFPWKWTNR